MQRVRFGRGLDEGPITAQDLRTRTFGWAEEDGEQQNHDSTTFTSLSDEQPGQNSQLAVTSIAPWLQHSQITKKESENDISTMVAHLHPRSRSTLSLFSGCLAICFLVVGAPHVLPCPVDATQFSDSSPSDQSGEPRRRRRRKQTAPSPDPDLQDDTDMSQMGRPKRECPVPKPTGLIGQVMGFAPHEQQQRPTVIIQSLRDRHARDHAQESNDKSL